jgi:DNA end-binding protein Ku
MPDRSLSGDERVERISLHLLNPKTHSRVKMRAQDAETGQELERSELVRAYEYSKYRYVVLTEDELEAIDIQLSKIIDLARFVDSNEVDLVYLDPTTSPPKAKSAKRRSKRRSTCSAKRWAALERRDRARCTH